MTRRWKAWLLALSLLCLAGTYAPAVKNDFVEFDDDDYVYLNQVVRQGLTGHGFVWAFTTGHAANYHPLTWLSHMADVSVYGLNPSGHHLTNILIHAINVCLIYLFLLRSTGALFRSWCVAILFLIHPLHVESVAWVSEKKDLLCAMFMLITLLIYAGYVRKPSAMRYCAILLTFTLALLSKPMAVTLPFLLLVLDYWPYNRYGDITLADTFPLRARKLVLEKIPLLSIALISSVVTFIVQQRGGAMNPLDHLSLATRLANGSVAYASYLWKFFWPTNLSVIYPHPGDSLEGWKIVISCFLLIVISTVAWRARKRAPFLISGWLWYLGMLVPVIGIVQVGYTAMADRYMYLPMAGIAIALIWGIAEAFQAKPKRIALLIIGIIIAPALIYLTQRQIGVWQNSETLFKHAIEVTENNAEAMTHLGVVYLRQNRPSDAIRPLEQAAKLRPSMNEAWSSLGVAYRMIGRLPESINAQKRALELNPADPEIHTNLGYVYAQSGDFSLAESHLREALRINPEYVPARNRLVELLSQTERTDEANRVKNQRGS